MSDEDDAVTRVTEAGEWLADGMAAGGPIISSFLPETMQKSSTSPEVHAMMRAKMQQAFELRVAGASNRQIAEQLHIKQSTVQAYIERRLLQTANARDMHTARELEAERLDVLQLAWALRSKNDPRAADIYLRILERRSRLFGLDAPQRIDLATVIGQIAQNEGWDLDATLADARMLVQARAIAVADAEGANTTEDGVDNAAEDTLPEADSSLT